MLEKLKSFLEDEVLYISILIIFVAIGSFGLGRISVSNEKTAENKAVGIESLPIEPEFVQSADVVESSEDFLVASKSGTRYHLLTCPGANQIKEGNKIFFSSVAAARAAGYTPAANCQF
jgi:hypothetical protein